ncbi:MAG: DUF2007 domain-containing protein [Gammaproteobacteria bacterium]|jgi:hypothetical protein
MAQFNHPGVTVFNTTNLITANLVRGMLEAEGIEVRMLGDALAGAYSGLPGAADITLMVPARMERRAREIIREYEQAPGLDDDE